MATTTFTDTQILNVNGAPFLVLKITVGYAQAGGSFVLIKKPNENAVEILPTPDKEYVFQVSLGTLIICTSTVQDINLSTNNTSVIHDFSGAQPSQFMFEKKVDHQNDKVVYEITYFVI